VLVTRDHTSKTKHKICCSFSLCVVAVCSSEEDCEWEEDDILVSATLGHSLDFLRMKVQEQVLRATGQKLWDIQIPCSGPHLRFALDKSARSTKDLIKER